MLKKKKKAKTTHSPPAVAVSSDKASGLVSSTSDKELDSPAAVSIATPATAAVGAA